MSERELVRSAVGVYGTLIAAAAAWMWYRDLPVGRVLVREPWAPLWQEVLVGVGVGLLVVGLGWLGSRYVESVRRLEGELKRLVPRLTGRGVTWLAVTSSVGEEIFFRGAMQDVAGLWVTAGVFAIAHGFFERKFLLWMVFAGVVGLGFGLMTEWYGGILSPVVAHFTINYVNLHRLNRKTEGRSL